MVFLILPMKESFFESKMAYIRFLKPQEPHQSRGSRAETIGSVFTGLNRRFIS